MTTPTLDALREVVGSSAAMSDDARTQQIHAIAEAPGEIDRAERYQKLRAFSAHHENKGRWSRFVMALMGAMIAYQSLLLTCVGLHLWDFTAYPGLLPGLLVQNLAQVVVLAHTIVKALHGGHKD